MIYLLLADQLLFHQIVLLHVYCVFSKLLIVMLPQVEFIPLMPKLPPHLLLDFRVSSFIIFCSMCPECFDGK